MGKVVSSASVSLDGYMAHPDDSIDLLFDWYESGDVEVPTAVPELTFQLTPESAAYWREWTSGIGALVVGRRLFDITDGWGGRHPLGVPVVVVTHSEPQDWAHPRDRTEFVTDGVAAAVARARELAGPDRNVGVAAGIIAGQCIELGLLDEVAMDLVPVVLGAGRPYFGDAKGPFLLEDPHVLIRGKRATHLVMRVRRERDSTAT
jgi:dihydrofolate reductase